MDVLLIQAAGGGGIEAAPAYEDTKSDTSKHQSSMREWLPRGNDGDEDDSFDFMAACAVVLKVGSFSDPPELQARSVLLAALLVGCFENHPELSAIIVVHAAS
jgi:hypothetical protein